MLEHNGRQGSKGVDISYSPPPLVPPAWQLTSRQPWGLWLVMAYCLDPVNARPPLCPQRSHINKSNPVSGSSEPVSDVGRVTRGELHQVHGKWGRLSYWMVLQKKINKLRMENCKDVMENGNFAWQLSWQVEVTTVMRKGRKRPENFEHPRN